MELQYKVVAEVEGLGKVIEYCAPWDEELKAFRALSKKLRIKPAIEPIAIWDFAKARIAVGDKDHYINRNGARTRHGLAEIKNANPILAIHSPLLDLNLARQVVEADTDGRYFSTKDTEKYDKLAKQAENEIKRGIAPEKRKAFILNSRKTSYLSPDANKDAFKGVFRDSGQDYLNFVGLPRIAVYPNPAPYIDGSNGTALTEVWFGERQYGSSLNCGDWILYGGGRAFGVFEKTAEGSSQKSEQGKVL